MEEQKGVVEGKGDERDAKGSNGRVATSGGIERGDTKME